MMSAPFPFCDCSHVIAGQTEMIPTLELDRQPGGRFNRKFPFSGISGCQACLTAYGFSLHYFCVPVAEGQSIVDALIAAVGRLGNVVDRLAVIDYEQLGPGERGGVCT